MRFEAAPQHRLAHVEHLAPRFFREVLEYDFEDCFVTDEAELWDFTTVVDPIEERRAQIAVFFERVQKHYFLDARHANSTVIVDLLEWLQAQGVSE